MGDAARSASALLIRTFSSENNYTLVCGDLYVYLRLGSSQFAPQYFPSRAPLVPYWGAHNAHGEGSVGKT